MMAATMMCIKHPGQIIRAAFTKNGKRHRLCDQCVAEEYTYAPPRETP